MKLALILNVVNSSLGGVLIRGEKGTAKSTAVRALADLLAEQNFIEGCKFSCDPSNEEQMCDYCLAMIKNNSPIQVGKGKKRVIDLPVSATEDRVVGTLDIEHAIKKRGEEI
ncbi:hypothetical protein [Alkalibaculum bacchi]|uniref:hypothetical protein n=1 Tax=Alkalibaculum bacchi TaxID=645887 RepID=UPI00350E3B5C